MVGLEGYESSVAASVLDDGENHRSHAGKPLRAKPKLGERVRALVAGSMPLVTQLVGRHRVAPHIRDELTCAGLEALSLAGLRYDPDQGPFEVFARATIRGALLRARGKEARAARLLEHGSVCASSSEDGSLEEPATWQTGDERIDLVQGLEQVAAGYLSLGSVRACNGEQSVLFGELCQEVLTALRTVTAAEREVFFGHLEGHTHEELRIAAGVSKRTVQRMIERALGAIRARLGR